MNDTMELCTVKIDLGGSNIHILGIYRPHAETIFTILSHNKLKITDFAVIGDLNTKLLQDSSEIWYF